MAFEKLTLFEIRLDDAHFGDSNEYEFDGEDGAESAEMESVSGGSRARRVAGLVAASVLVSVAAALAARRLLGGDEDEEAGEAAEIELEEDVDTVA
ncbi:hypothetical protein [Haloarchaeobius sp. HRN-SO-5]|uniref:hypothetical protein n=1 Tax=Haloarchaeobius sp. HRN-SO-5 TaxID=3446118 RepID=UPI003EBCD972